MIYIKPALAKFKKSLLKSDSKMKLLAGEFFTLNSPFWKDEPPLLRKGKILYFTRLFYPYTVVNVMPFLKYLSKKYSKQLIVASEHCVCDKDRLKIYDSYNIDGHITVADVPLVKQIYFLLLSLRFWLLRKKGDDILKLKYHDVPFGEDVYDAIIRNDVNLYTLDRIKIHHAYIILKCFFHMYAAEKIFKEGSYDMFVYTDCDYELCGYPKMAMKYGVRIWQDVGSFITEHRERKNYKVINKGFINREEFEKISRELSEEDLNIFLKKHFCGFDENYIDRKAYYGKRKYDINELYRSLNVKTKANSNVLVAAHTFSDTAHYGCNILYKDYFTWLIETVKILSKNTNINVFVKEHPSAWRYEEEGSVLRYFEEHKYSNVYVLPKDFNTLSAFSIMDAVITCQGTIGLEATIWGVPVFLAGEGYYSGFGIGHLSKTVAEYENKLLHVTEYEKPDRRKKDIAKILLYIAVTKRSAIGHDLIDADVFKKDWNAPDSDIYQLESVNAYLKAGVDPRGRSYYKEFNNIRVQEDFL